MRTGQHLCNGFTKIWQWKANKHYSWSKSTFVDGNGRLSILYVLIRPIKSYTCITVKRNCISKGTIIVFNVFFSIHFLTIDWSGISVASRITLVLGNFFAKSSAMFLSILFLDGILSRSLSWRYNKCIHMIFFFTVVSLLSNLRLN